MSSPCGSFFLFRSRFQPTNRRHCGVQLLLTLRQSALGSRVPLTAQGQKEFGRFGGILLLRFLSTHTRHQTERLQVVNNPFSFERPFIAIHSHSLSGAQFGISCPLLHTGLCLCCNSRAELYLQF